MQQRIWWRSVVDDGPRPNYLQLIPSYIYYIYNAGLTTRDRVIIERRFAGERHATSHLPWIYHPAASCFLSLGAQIRQRQPPAPGPAVGTVQASTGHKQNANANATVDIPTATAAALESQVIILIAHYFSSRLKCAVYMLPCRIRS